jgi:hypothetical protein
MSNVKFNALASLALLAGAPVAAQAAMTEMADVEMSDVSGQAIVGPITFAVDTLVGVGTTLTDPFNNTSPAYIPGKVATATGTAVNTAIGHLIDFHLLPFNAPSSALGAFNGRVIDNSKAVGKDVADIAFMGPFRVLDLIGQGKSTALDYLFLPVSAPLDIIGNVFDSLNSSIVGTSTKILTAPINAVFKPVNRVVDGVTGRAKATVDGVAYSITEVNGALITGLFASASQGAANNGLNFTSRVFGRIAQAQAGLTKNRLTSLAGTYGYKP